MTSIAVIGLGYLGLTTGLGMAHHGWSVRAYDIDAGRREGIRRGRAPFHEPGIPEALARLLGRGFFVEESLDAAIAGADVIFLCVGTPGGADGFVDLRPLTGVIEMLLGELDGAGDRILVVRSTVPPTTLTNKLASLLDRGLGKDRRVVLASNPEFLREGTAWTDFVQPDRVVLGAETREAAERLAAIYAPFACPIHVVSPTTAEFVKYLSNSLLATLISFANEFAMLADHVGGVDVANAFDILKQDRRWSGQPAAMATYAFPGCGFGGYCLPKDAEAVTALSRSLGFPMLQLDAVMENNRRVMEHAAEKIVRGYRASGGGTLGVLGLAFKPGTSDVRGTPAGPILQKVRELGCVDILAFDPMAGKEFLEACGGVRLAASASEVVENASCIAVLTAWPEFAGALAGVPANRVLDLRHSIRQSRGQR